jgi:hypothetical protein
MTVVAEAVIVALHFPALFGTGRYWTGTDSTDWYAGHSAMGEG